MPKGEKVATAANHQRDKLGNATDVASADDAVLRANFYGLLARALARPLDDDALEVMRALSDHQDDTPLGKALNAFGKLAQRTPRARAEEEYSTLFYGFGAGGELTPYASYYLTGLVYDKPLAELRADMAQLGIAAADDNSEPEDHIASLCEMMHGILTGALGNPGSAKTFFDKHLAPWAGKFFADLEKAPSAVMYMPLGTIGRLFIEFEREAFEMAA
jgi:TorA maturation chaperone TorD